MQLSIILCLAVSFCLEVFAEEKKFSFGFSSWWNDMKGAMKSSNWDEKRRKEGQTNIRYLLRDREDQSWTALAKNGTVPEIWHEDGAIKVLIHGYSSNIGADDQMKIIRNQFIFDIGMVYGRTNKTVNVIVVDWTALSVDTTSKYPEIVKNLPYAAESIVELLQNLKEAEKIKDFKNVHLIGLGLGAHLAGMVGRKVRKGEDKIKLGRITGLDPNFNEIVEEDGTSYKNKSIGLGKKDAEFVDIIHCNMGKSNNYVDASIKGQFGSTVQAGHVDFYPNGGKKQKDCPAVEENAEKACSQRKCASHYADSMIKKLVACPCDDWEFYKADKCSCTLEDGGVLMGDPCNPDGAKGRYYLAIPKDKKNEEEDTNDHKHNENEWQMNRPAAHHDHE